MNIDAPICLRHTLSSNSLAKGSELLQGTDHRSSEADRYATCREGGLDRYMGACGERGGMGLAG